MPTFDASGLEDLPRAALGDLLATVGEFVVVGKIAIDVVARGMARLPPDRLTRDVDVAISVGSDAAFDERVTRLEDGHGTRFRFRAAGTAVDVLPYGGLARHDEVVMGEDHLDVAGMKDAARTAVRVDLGGGLVVSVASLPALVALKLVAWEVRGWRTGDKDARDLGLLLRASTSGDFEDELWEDEEALLAMSYDPERTGPFRVGRAIAADFEPRLVTRVAALVEGDSGARLRSILSTSSGLPAEQLAALRAGLAVGRTAQ